MSLLLVRCTVTMPAVTDFHSTAVRVLLGIAAPIILACEAHCDLLHDWDLKGSRWSGAEVSDLASGRKALASTAPRFQDGGLILDETCHIEAPAITHESLPTRELSVEAWVSISKGQRWGNIVGYLQDNGNYERGWSLGYNETAFTFWISTGGGMILVTADSSFVVDEWAHVAATFDGRKLRLYVNGELAGQTEAEGGIAYPEKALYTIGAYLDDNEFYPMHGKLMRVKVLRSCSQGGGHRKRAGFRGLAEAIRFHRQAVGTIPGACQSGNHLGEFRSRWRIGWHGRVRGDRAIGHVGRSDCG